MVKQCNNNLKTLGVRRIEPQHSTTPMTRPDSLVRLGAVASYWKENSTIGCNLPKLHIGPTEPQPILGALYVGMPRILYGVYHSDQICCCC